jgi:hypothetical protein
MSKHLLKVCVADDTVKIAYPDPASNVGGERWVVGCFRKLR